MGKPHQSDFSDIGGAFLWNLRVVYWCVSEEIIHPCQFIL